MLALSRVLSSLLDVLSPPQCAACDAPAREVFCDACAVSLRRLQPTLFDGVPLLVGGSYAPPLSSAIVRFKYEGRAELAARLGSLIARQLREAALPRHSLLVPVPLHARRLATRGYNQAGLLAQALAGSTGLTCAPRLLLRSRETDRQVGKSRELRLVNADGAFELNTRVLARQRSTPVSAVLVDDVVTTGSTVRACAQTLAAAGVRLVAVAALAQARAG